MLAVACTSKKLKSLNNLVLVKKFSITIMQDVWLLNISKANATKKAQIKKTTDAEKKVLKKKKKIKEKEKAKLKKKYYK